MSIDNFESRALGFGAFKPVLGAEILDEIIKMGTLQRSLFQSEVLICAQIINPNLCPWFFAGRFAVEEEHICSNTVGVLGRRSRM